MARRVWGSQSIRELARERLRASELGSRTHLQSVPKESDTPEPESSGEGFRFTWGAFQQSLTKKIYVIVPAEEIDGGAEIRHLCSSLGLETSETMILTRHRKIDSATYIGRGSVPLVKNRMKALGCTALVIDAPLRPGQVRNIEQELEAPVIDREGIILAIFDHNAKTRLAKMQVELAQLKYLQPRLTGLWLGLSRQRGGKGGLGGRGLGETRLELDRRVVRDRISVLTRKLKSAEKSLEVQAQRRAALPRVALAGYTNAGKSTLMGRLTGCDVEARDSLFSTLDTTVRSLVPPTQPKILISDTVGFVKNLPHDLIASFRSTLKEALDSQLILHVLDASHPNWLSQLETTEEVLNDIGGQSVSKILVINKIDLLGIQAKLRVAEIQRRTRHFVNYIAFTPVSALSDEGIESLRSKLLDFLGARDPEWAQA